MCPVNRRGVLGDFRIWIFSWKNVRLPGEANLQNFGSRCVTPHSYHGMFSLYSAVFATLREFCHFQDQKSAPAPTCRASNAGLVEEIANFEIPFGAHIGPGKRRP